MLNKIKRPIYILLFVFLAIYCIDWFYFDYTRFNDEYLFESTSPNESFTIKIFRSKTDTVTPIVLGELTINKKNKETKFIYFDEVDNAKIEWLDDDTVLINNVPLELPEEYWHIREGVKKGSL
ncbi:DUF5412 family protein [Ferdinandcohnia sp. SAFN-114]|uniref:DUF5412 family protein n=1 Tax=Ferdinandcohnia sp. SAFN-114 TaxID=3387275 RepID=UPI003F7E6D31